ncbi:MAG: 5'-methylthioadenosine/adenosylhomocysteine nucleosidase [Lachnospiraceae bacterium]|nr:5'-methylthioadenosine/adenosylhomocysteine nucleosidase [Lachnospiraceae bacterium]
MKKTGIIGAMEIEVEGLKKAMQVHRTVEKARMTFLEGTLCGQDVVIVRSGVGKVNAAVCTQILADEFGVDLIINTGVAGSLKSEIDIEDIVIATDVMHHDVDATLFGYQPGEVPQLGVVSFHADDDISRIAAQVSRDVNPEIKVFRGRIVSGDQFIFDTEIKQRIKNTFEGFCTEMEGAAIAQTAWLNGIPFVIIRAISDKAGDSEQMDYPVFEARAAADSLRLVEGLMRRFSEDQTK